VSDKNTNSCPQTCNETVTGTYSVFCILFVFMLVLYCYCVATEFSVNKDLYIFYHTDKILQTRKLEKKSIFSMLFLKTFKDVKISWKHRRADGRTRSIALLRPQLVGLYSVEPYTQS